jgi:hypothetical protein
MSTLSELQNEKAKSYLFHRRKYSFLLSLLLMKKHARKPATKNGDRKPEMQRKRHLDENYN